MRRHSHRWADVGGLESSWRESLDWLQGLRTKLCLGAATRSLYGQTKALGESLKAGGTTLGHRRCVAWVRSIAQVRMCRTLSPRPDSLSIQSHTSHARKVETLTLFQRHFRLSTCRDSITHLCCIFIFIFTILINIIHCVPSRASHLFPSIWLSCLAALLAGILIHSSDCPSLCCTAVQERRTARALHFSLAQVSTQEIATQILFEIQWVRTPWSLKAKVTASDG